MKKVFYILLTQSIAAATYAQQINGAVTNEQGSAVANATVSLLRAKDSSVVKQTLAKEGLYAFSLAGTDSFLIQASHVGYQSTYSAPFRYNGAPVKMPALVLSTQKNNLTAITVSARKPMVEVKPNKTVLNVEGTVNATGTDALELLRKAPGVLVENDDLVSLNGKSSVQIYIDNRPTPLTTQDLAAYLRTLPSSQIEAIEILSSPSAQYEAAGSGGIINIRLKKARTQGLNGTANLGASASATTRYEAGFSLNYRNRKLNVFGSYQHNNGDLKTRFSLNRVLNDSAFDQQSRIVVKNNNHSFKTGLDYTLSAKSVIGAVVHGGFSKPFVENRSLTPISDAKTGEVSRILSATNLNTQQNNNLNANLNYSYKDSLGRSLLVNADYGFYSLKQNQVQPNTFLDATGKNDLYHRNYVISSPTEIAIYALKADYETGFAKGRLGIGGKWSYVTSNNRFSQYNNRDGQLEQDWERSNLFDYKENVNAGYLVYTKELRGISVQGGLRAEQTVLQGDLTSYREIGEQVSTGTTRFEKKYLDFFPSLSLTLAPKTQNQFVLSYSRRIDRPAYKDLNPFEYRLNEYTLHKGSVDMRPQYANTVSLTHTHKFRLNTTLSYSHVKDLFGQLVDTVQGTKGVLINKNLASQNITSLAVSYPFQYKQYSLFANINVHYSTYKADYGQGRNLALDVWAFHFYAQNTFRFGDGWTAELSGFYASPSIWQGTLRTTAIWSADAGLQKQLPGKKFTIKASVSDLFKTLQWTATSNFVGQQVVAAGRPDSRQFKLSLTYRFGNSGVKAARQLATGTEDESKRVQGSGGLTH